MIEALHPGLAALGAGVAVAGYLEWLRRLHLDPDAVRLPWATALGTGLVLSRLCYGIERGLAWQEILVPRPGGYILYGALPAILVVPVWLRARGRDPRPYVDGAAPFLLLALVPARLGCWWADCCRGVPVELLGSRFPVQPLLALGNACLGLLAALRIGRGRPSGTAALALAGHSSLRTLLDPLRERSITQDGVGPAILALALLRFVWIATRRGR